MPDSITIPASIDDAVEALTGLGELITARKWERAAIVAAFVHLDQGHGGRETSTSGRLSARQFAELGIVGLSATTSVTKYVQAWLDTHDGKYPRPGATRRLPTSTFPPMRTGTDGHNSDDGMRDTVDRIMERHGPEAVAEHVATRAPHAAARAVTRVPAASAAADQERTRTRDIYERGREQYDRIGDAVDRATTAHERSGLGEHEAERDLRTACSFLRRAADSYRRNPELTDDQRERVDDQLDQVVHLERLLRGDTPWTDADRDWLANLDVEGV